MRLLWYVAAAPLLAPILLALAGWSMFQHYVLRRQMRYEGQELFQVAVEWTHAVLPGHRWGPHPQAASSPRFYEGVLWCPGCCGWRVRKVEVEGGPSP